MALQASRACLLLRPTSVGNMLLRCLNNLQENTEKRHPCYDAVTESDTYGQG